MRPGVDHTDLDLAEVPGSHLPPARLAAARAAATAWDSRERLDDRADLRSAPARAAPSRPAQLRLNRPDSSGRPREHNALVLELPVLNALSYTPNDLHGHAKRADGVRPSLPLPGDGTCLCVDGQAHELVAGVTAYGRGCVRVQEVLQERRPG
jgi:hypothetical protein